MTKVQNYSFNDKLRVTLFSMIMLEILITKEIRNSEIYAGNEVINRNTTKQINKIINRNKTKDLIYKLITQLDFKFAIFRLLNRTK